MIKAEKITDPEIKNLYLFTLENEFMEVGILNFGGIIKYFHVKTPRGQKNIVFGAESVAEYRRENNYSSAIIGRAANRIKNGTFVLNGKRYEITKNDGEHTNHGGVEGFDKKMFDYRIKGDTLTLLLTSGDGDQGFPGTLDLKVEYRLRGNEFEIRFHAKSDKDTVFAPTYHPYFNLSDHKKPIYDTVLKIHSDKIALLDKNGFPKQELCSVKNTVFDFSAYKPIGECILSDDGQIKLCGGADHCFLSEEDFAASAYDEKSGISLRIFSDLQGIQLYTANDFPEKPEKSRFFRHCAFCLEPQFFPDSVNSEIFEKPILKANTEKNFYIKYVVRLRGVEHRMVYRG